MSRRTKTKHPVTGDALWKFESSGEPEDISAFSREVEGKKANMSFAFLEEESVEASIEVEFSVDNMEDDDIEFAVRRICRENPISFVGYNCCTNSIVIGIAGHKTKDVMFLEPFGSDWHPSEMESIWKPADTKKRVTSMFYAMETLAECKAEKTYQPLTEAKDALSKMYADSFYAFWA